MNCRRIASIIFCLIGLQVAGCQTDFGPVSTQPDPEATTHVALQAGNKIKVAVYGEPDLTGVYDIAPDGTVTLPLAGTIKAAGRSRAALQRAITRKYSAKMQDPQVTVEVVEFRPFYVMGEIATPGQYPYRSGLNALTAISTAGGLTYRASRSEIFIQHAGEHVWHEHALTSSVLIEPGDLIRIPERYF
ncbi:MAG: polysaccharide biosynthesis/export family protein [Methylovirgula sp.]